MNNTTYTFRPQRNGGGYDVTQSNSYTPLETVATRVEAERRVKARNLEERSAGHRKQHNHRLNKHLGCRVVNANNRLLQCQK